jgi:hypothetical protein
MIHCCGAGRRFLWCHKADERLNHILGQHKRRSKVTTYRADWRELSKDRGGPDGGGGEEGVLATAMGEGLLAVVGDVVRPGGGGRGSSRVVATGRISRRWGMTVQAAMTSGAGPSGCDIEEGRPSGSGRGRPAGRWQEMGSLHVVVLGEGLWVKKEICMGCGQSLH